MADRIGQYLGKYHLTHLLGQGGFAEVYLGVHRHLGTEAAIKILHTHLATAGDIEQFRAESRTVAALVHPNIVRVFDFDVEEGTPYLVMDYAPNGSLRQRLLAGKPLAPAEVVPLLTQVADALQYAHEQKLVHRDIKPENILIGRGQNVLLSDFGIAVFAQSTGSQKTQGVAGTTAYMSPEQLQGKPRPASDLYSLGVVVYEALAGERPFQGSFTEVATQHLFAPPPPLRDKVPAISPLVEQVVLTVLAKDPKERFSSVRAFAAAFAQASQESGMLPSLSTQAAMPPLPPNQGVASLFSATTRLSPPPAHPEPPGVSPAPSQPAGGQDSPPAPSVLFAPTQLTPPASATALPPGGSGPQEVQAGPAMYLPPGWAAAQATPTSPTTYPFTPPASILSTISGTAPGGAALAKVPENHQRLMGRRRRILISVAVLLLVVVLGGIAFAVFGVPSATVTIQPATKPLSNTFNISAVAGTPDASKQEVGTTPVSATTSAYTKTVDATGQATKPGARAGGSMGFRNTSTLDATFLAGQRFVDCCGRSNLVIVLETSTVVPAYGQTNASAHISQVGGIGNIDLSADTLNCYDNASSGCSLGDVTISMNGPFTGGQDPQTYPVVAQSDIDNAANALIAANMPDPMRVLQGKIPPNQQLAGNPSCTPTITEDHQAGDQATQVTVRVTFTCTGLGYDQSGAKRIAAQLLTDQATTDFGPEYALTGNIETNVTQTTIVDPRQGTATLTVTAAGIWAYQFNSAQQQAMARLVAGKSKQEAIDLLQGQSGVMRVSVDLSGLSGENLPTDPSRIKVVVQAAG